MAAQRGDRFPLLDGYRAAAALGVVVLHAYLTAGLGAKHGLVTSAMFVVGWLCMALFFTLSGFVLYRPFLMLQRYGGTPDVATYLRRRALRIFPAWWLLLAITAFWPGVGSTYSVDWIEVWLLIQHYGAPNAAAVAVGHSWSLAAELAFYAALPLLAWIGARTGPRAMGPVAVVATVFAVSVAANWQLPSLRLTAASVGLQFALGMALAVVSVWRPVDAPPSIVRVAAVPTIACVLAAVAAGVLVAERKVVYYPGDADLLRWRVCTALFAVAVLVPGIFVTTNGGAMRWLLGSKVMTWLGERSYGLYLWHFPIVAWVAGRSALLPTRPFLVTVQDYLPGPDVMLILGATLALTIPIAAVSYQLVERPLMRLGEARLPRQAAPVLGSVGP